MLTMRPKDVKELIDAGKPVVLLDVRTDEEVKICQLPGSVHIPLQELTHRVGELELPAGVPVVVYCHHGIRSQTGAAILEQAGCPNAFSMIGGIDAWSVFIDPAVPRY